MQIEDTDDCGATISAHVFIRQVCSARYQKVSCWFFWFYCWLHCRQDAAALHTGADSASRIVFVVVCVGGTSANVTSTCAFTALLYSTNILFPLLAGTVFLEYFEKCGVLLLVCPLVAPFLGMKSSFEADTLLSFSEMSVIILLWSTLGQVVSLILIFLLS